MEPQLPISWRAAGEKGEKAFPWRTACGSISIRMCGIIPCRTT